MLSIKKAKHAACSLVLTAALCVGAADFGQANKNFRSGHCGKAIQMGEQVSRRSPNLPAQVRADQEAELQKWRAALAACTQMLPAQYKEQLARFESEYHAVAKSSRGAATTDRACELLRRISVFVSEVKASQLECECLDFVSEVEQLQKKSVALCPEPCRQADQQLDDVLKNVYSISSNVKLSANLLKLNQVGDFRKRIRRYKFQLLANKDQVDSLMGSMDYCLSRSANRNVGLIQGAAENLANGLGVLDRICGYLENIQSQSTNNAVRNSAFRDSIDQFYSQVSGIVDQWLAVSTPGDNAGNVSLQESTGAKMHDMFFKLAKVDMQRSLYLLDRPVDEKKGEIARLRSLSFERDLDPEEARQLDELRNHLIQKLYLSIPWPIRFWEAKRATAIVILAAAALVFAGLLVLLVHLLGRRRDRQRIMEL